MWLRSQLDEDEQVALGIGGPHWEREGLSSVVEAVSKRLVVHGDGMPEPSQAVHIARWDPARVLAEVEAKRGLITEVVQLDQSADVDAGPTAAAIARLLAQPYAGREGWRDDWSVSTPA